MMAKSAQLNLVPPIDSQEPVTIDVPAVRIPEAPSAIAGPPDDEDDTGSQQWWTDSPQVLLQEQPRTAVYVNPYGVAVIRQQADYSSTDEDSLIFVTRSNLRSVINRLVEIEKGGG
jgi:hypothetical protein